MTRLSRANLMLAIAMSGILWMRTDASTATPPVATDPMLENPVLEDAFALPTPSGATTAALYITLSLLRGKVTLTGASSPAAQGIELHEMQMREGRMHMRQLGHLTLSPESPLEMRPGGGPHLMLTGLTQPISSGDEIPVTLHFQARPDQQIRVPVKDYSDIFTP
ncbi:copper chaperone PCu(A)C [Cobetia marina]|uniref:copper chaperone PCu(A)C n=1 Tax=Cobetia marina TaxID=28258 RepID=UPI0026E30F59|nr:copper chaperone PCu(A)C [Cobetia marina]MDO6788589.1 copper chaperone PCu(A)C [Cobetia marina]